MIDIFIRSVPVAYYLALQYFLRQFLFANGWMTNRYDNMDVAFYWFWPFLMAVPLTLATGAALAVVFWVLTGRWPYE